MEDTHIKYKRKRIGHKLSAYEKENAVLRQRIQLLEKELSETKCDGEFLKRTYEQS